MSDTETTRLVPVTHGSDGSISGHTVTSPVDNKVRAAMIIPPRDVVPIIFVPGIMGSNLRAAKAITSRQWRLNINLKDPVWRLDSSAKFAQTWAGRNGAQRQLLIDHTALESDPDGLIELRADEQAKLPLAYTLFGDESAETKKNLDRGKAIVAGKRERGWGTVAWAFYGAFLNWLEGSLQGIGYYDGKPNAPMQALLELVGTTPAGATVKPAALTEAMLKHTLKFQLPVHAFGYNWAASNLESGAKLAQYISATIAKYHNNRLGQRCSQVIVLTHSMGGLVARAAVKTSGAEAQVLGVIHGVMPTHGAAAMYKRFVAGFGGEGDGLVAYMTNRALGNTAQETTPVLAFNPGPLELAPNTLYNGGKPWLIIRDINGAILESQPATGNPYNDIYRNATAWWRPAHLKWMNPAGLKIPSGALWKMYLQNVDAAESYHTKLAANGFHENTIALYSDDRDYASWGMLDWTASRTEMYQEATPVSGSVESWTVTQQDGGRAVFLQDQANATIATVVEYGRDAGDGTVPALASAAGVDSHATIVARHSPGYEHSAAYNDTRVRHAVLDGLTRLLQKAPVSS